MIAQHPNEDSRFRQNCAKMALLRGVKKIATEVVNRRRGLLSKNEFVRSMLKKFEPDYNFSFGRQ